MTAFLSRGEASAGFHLVFCYERTGRRVLVFEVPSVSLSRDVCTRNQSGNESTHNACEQMIREKFESWRLDISFQSVQLDTVSTVYKHVFFCAPAKKDQFCRNLVVVEHEAHAPWAAFHERDVPTGLL